MLSIARLTSATVLTAFLGTTAVPDDAVAAPLARVRTWGYQLQDIDPAILSRSACDLLVIDYSRDGTRQGELTATDLAALKKRAGEPRIVLAYLSIGEAEDYRFYWQATWRDAPPGWLAAPSPGWPGNYRVRYWDRSWQVLLFGDPGAYLDRIISAGFDGIYLDRIDSFEAADPALSREARKAAMRDLVLTLARYARARHPGFLVVAQNGEELLTDPAYQTAIDGFAKEDLFYGAVREEARNAPAQISASLALIHPFFETGKPVFLVEYLTEPHAIAQIRERAARLGAPLFIGSRELDRAPRC